MSSPDPTTPRRDEATIAYFDSYVPEYSVERLEHAVAFLRGHAGPESSLIDLGCGVGNTLDHIVNVTGVTDVAGLDVSAQCLARTRERIPNCETFEASIFDEALPAIVSRRFDVAVVAAVLHHLIGRTRAESRQYAMTALRNARQILRPGGHLILIEPVFYPPRAMDAVFYLKKSVSRVTPRRIPVFGYWNNIGAPVVSYYTNEELEGWLKETGFADVVDRHIEPDDMGRVLGTVLRKTNTTIIARAS